jgi:hypothetical protein
MSDIIGISCVFGVTIGYSDLLSIFDIDPHFDQAFAMLQQLLSKKSTGMSVYTHPDWEDMVILGTTVVTLDVDPSLQGSTMAPVITIPDVIDFSEYSDERPMYYQVPIMEI